MYMYIHIECFLCIFIERERVANSFTHKMKENLFKMVNENTTTLCLCERMKFTHICRDGGWM